MSFTKCCNLRFIGDNHSPIQPDGYCLHCGFHPEIQKLQHQLEIQTKRVENLKKSLLVYESDSRWTHGKNQFEPIFILFRNEICANQVASIAIAIDQELEKQLGEVK